MQRCRGLMLSAAFAVLCAAVHVARGQVPQFGQQYGLDGTYYGVQSPYGQGHCSFQFADSYRLPWTTGVSVPLALNGPQYADSTPCGMCIQYRGVGTGSGLTPIQVDEWKFGIISDECPECLSGSLDLAADGDGRWQIEWIPVQCNVGTSTFMYSLQGSNNYFVKLMIANTRVPVKSVNLNGVEMSKTIDNYWLATASQAPGYVFPLPITVTSVLGDTVTDILPASLAFSDGTATGSAQFPISCNYASVQPSGSLSLSGQPDTSGVQACPSPSNSSSGSPANPSPTPLTTSTPTPTSTPAPIATSTPTPTQTPAPIAASPPPPQATASPAPISTPSPTSVSRPSSTPVSTPLPLPPQGSPIRSPAPAPTPDYNTCTDLIPLSGQCGGEGGQCTLHGKELNISNCIDDEWVGACCQSGAFCQRQQRFLWTCATLDAPNTTYPVQDNPIASLYQCGGLGTCPKNLCADKQWANTTCEAGSTCTRYDQNYWQCRPLPFSVPVPAILPPAPISLAG